MIQNSSINSVLLLPDGRIAQNRKEACEILGIKSSCAYRAIFKRGEIELIANPELNRDEQTPTTK